MRQLGTVAAEQAARRFVDYLLTKGIAASAEPGPTGWTVWVRNEDHLEEARQEFAAFSAAPDAATYREASRAADQVRAEEQRRVREAKKNFVDVSRKWRAGTLRRCPVTSILVAASIVVTLLAEFGKNRSVTFQFFIVPAGPDWYLPLQYAWYREPWRLITPIFLHFSIWHILFDMIMLVQFGRPIEAVRGSLRYAAIVLIIAVTSNVGQYVLPLLNHEDPMIYFGGMSGVVYGLFGYLWMKSRYEPSAGFYLPTNAVTWMIGWFLLCLFGVIGHVANGVHGVGLAVGIIIGRWPSLWRSLR